MRGLFFILLLLASTKLSAQLSFEAHFKSLQKITLDSGVTLTIDESTIDPLKPTKVILYALPNGNTTAQTFGKSLAAGEDWHFDIQHIGAQTAFIRQADQKTNYIVIYVENNLKSWPTWRRKIGARDEQIGQIVEMMYQRYQKYHAKMILSSHSGGGSFIFGYLNSQFEIPTYLERIGFLDATYGYETANHAEKLKQWLKNSRNALQVFAYNDSVVVFQGKPLVSPTGGTWYRSKLMAKDLKQQFNLKEMDLPDRLLWTNKRQGIVLNLIKNPEGKIYHTVLVEKNGFIALIFNGTKFQDIGYQFWGDRAYQGYVLH